MAHGDGDNVYQFSAQSLEGDEVSLSQYAGQVLVIVNTASKCVFTSQFEGLETLYRQYKDRGAVVLGFPCNQFGAQEPGTAAQIGQFCERNYGVSFPMFAKVDVNGPKAHPLFKFLKNERGGLLGMLGVGSIKWNFTKFLVDRKGAVVARFAPGSPVAQIGPRIDKLL